MFLIDKVVEVFPEIKVSFTEEEIKERMLATLENADMDEFGKLQVVLDELASARSLPGKQAESGNERGSRTVDNARLEVCRNVAKQQGGSGEMNNNSSSSPYPQGMGEEGFIHLGYGLLVSMAVSYRAGYRSPSLFFDSGRRNLSGVIFKVI